SVVSVNLLPEHKAVLEGSREEMLHGGSLRMNLDRVDLQLRPQSVFQTNTAVAISLYEQVAELVDAPSSTSPKAIIRRSLICAHCSRIAGGHVPGWLSIRILRDG